MSKLLQFLLLILLVKDAPANERPVRFLCLGDSQSYGVFGSILHRMMNNGRAEMTTVARCGANPRGYTVPGDHHTCGTWTAPPRGVAHRTSGGDEPGNLPHLVSEHRPDVIMVQLGDNMLNLTVEESRRQLREMAQKLRETGKPCVWVGPHDGDGHDRARRTLLYEDLQNMISDVCSIVDSRPLVTFPAGIADGIHFDQVYMHDLILSGRCSVLNAGASVVTGDECQDGPYLAQTWAQGVYRHLAARWPLGAPASVDVSQINRFMIHAERVIRGRYDRAREALRGAWDRVHDGLACPAPPPI